MTTSAVTEYGGMSDAGATEMQAVSKFDALSSRMKSPANYIRFAD